MVQDVEFTVLARTRRTPVIVEVALRPVSEPLPYVAGQYALLGDRDYTIPVRSYSIANAPCASNRISLLVTRVPDGKTSKWVHDSLAVGDTVLVSGPYGTFVADPAGDRPVLCLAGGSGLAPVRALAEEAVSRRSPEDFTLLFSGRTRPSARAPARRRSWRPSGWPPRCAPAAPTRIPPWRCMRWSTENGTGNTHDQRIGQLRCARPVRGR